MNFPAKRFFIKTVNIGDRATELDVFMSECVRRCREMDQFDMIFEFLFVRKRTIIMIFMAF